MKNINQSVYIDYLRTNTNYGNARLANKLWFGLQLLVTGIIYLIVSVGVFFADPGVVEPHIKAWIFFGTSLWVCASILVWSFVYQLVVGYFDGIDSTIDNHRRQLHSAR